MQPKGNETSSALTPTETAEIIKKLIHSSYSAKEADNLLKNPSTITTLLHIFKEQVQKLPSIQISGTESESGDQAISSGTNEADEEVPGPSTSPGRSRTKTRKKNTKRRSSLEKLHDALQEMRFDAMLPLGPRRCTVSI